jgi:hypothetical protein
MHVEPSYKGINASVFFDDHDFLQSMLIICGTARNFKSIQLTTVGKLSFNKKRILRL